MDDSDSELRRRVHGGDEAAFLVLYERHRRPLFRFANRMLGGVPVAEDVVHVCFLVILADPMKGPSSSSGPLRLLLEDERCTAVQKAVVHAIRVRERAQRRDQAR